MHPNITASLVKCFIIRTRKQIETSMSKRFCCRGVIESATRTKIKYQFFVLSVSFSVKSFYFSFTYSSNVTFQNVDVLEFAKRLCKAYSQWRDPLERAIGSNPGQGMWHSILPSEVGGFPVS